LLDDRSNKVRAAALAALGEYGADPAATTVLAAAAKDDDQAVRLAAARTLLKINGSDDPTAAAVLLAIVADPDPASTHRQEAMKLLRQTSEKSQEQAMKALAEMIPRVDPIVLPEVINCLTSAGPIARIALPSLDKLLDGKEPVTRAAATSGSRPWT
jgi:HEAT repeat protein